MLLFDLAVQLTVGAVYALGSREELVEDGVAPFAHPSFRNGLAFSAFLYVPSAAFFLMGWPAWNSMYLFDIDNLRWAASWFAYADAAALFACFVLGFRASVVLLRRTRGRPPPLLLALGALWLVVCLLLFVVMWGRSFAVTTYQDFLARDWPRFSVRWGAPDSLFGGPLMWWLAAWCCIDFVPLALLYRRARARTRGAPPSAQVQPPAGRAPAA